MIFNYFIIFRYFTIKIWINGVVVHNNDALRGYTEKEDEAPIRLEEGVNRILVKITNAVHGWGFGVAVPRPNF